MLNQTFENCVNCFAWMTTFQVNVSHKFFYIVPFLHLWHFWANYFEIELRIKLICQLPCTFCFVFLLNKISLLIKVPSCKNRPLCKLFPDVFISFIKPIKYFKSGMHNIRPAGQMWPVEAFNLGRKTLNFVYFAFFFGKNTL